MTRRMLLPALALVLLWMIMLLVGGASFPPDTILLDWLHPVRRDVVVDLAWAITWLGDGAMLIPVAAAGAAFLMTRRQWGDALALVAATASVRMMVTAQKGWFGHARPHVLQWMPESSPGFPSGHAANSLVTWMALAMLLTGSRRAMAAALALSFLIGLSRVVLGVHWPSDVIGGWAIGALAALMVWQFRIPLARGGQTP